MGNMNAADLVREAETYKSKPATENPAPASIPEQPSGSSSSSHAKAATENPAPASSSEQPSGSSSSSHATMRSISATYVHLASQNDIVKKLDMTWKQQVDSEMFAQAMILMKILEVSASSAEKIDVNYDIGYIHWPLEEESVSLVPCITIYGNQGWQVAHRGKISIARLLPPLQ